MNAQEAIDAGTQNVLYGEPTPYIGAINLCARTYAEMRRRNVGFDYWVGMRHQVAVLIGAHLNFPGDDVIMAVTTNVLDYWVAWVRRTDNW